MTVIQNTVCSHDLENNTNITILIMCSKLHTEMFQEL